MLSAAALLVALSMAAFLMATMVSYRSSVQEAYDKVGNLSTPMAANIDLFWRTVDRGLTVVQSSLAGRELVASPDLHALLRETSEHAVAPIEIAVISAEGRLLATSRTTETKPILLADREYYWTHAQLDADVLFTGAPIVSRLTPEDGLAIPISRSLRDSSGRFRGVVLALVPQVYVDTFFTERAFSSTVLGVARQDHILVSAISGGAPPDKAEELSRISRDIAASSTVHLGSRARVRLADDEYFVSWGRAPNANLEVLAAIPEREGLAPFYANLARSGSLFAAMSIVVLASGFALDRQRRRREHEDALARRLMNAAFAGISDPLILLDSANRVQLANDATRTLSADPIAGRTLREALAELDARAVISSADAARIGQTSIDRELINGDRQLLATFYPVSDSVLLHLRDISDLRRVESQLRQAQKMEAIGQLTGGVAHDFNNLLTVILGSLEVIEGAPGVAPQIRKSAVMAMRAGERAAELTANLLAIGRRQALAPRPTEVNDLVSRTIELMRRLLPENIEIRTVLSSKAWLADVDPAQLETALINLAVNARDAMPDGGKLTIETSNEYLDEVYAGLNNDVVPGPYLHLAMSDTGSGISAEALERVFEPFFTTKEEGKGSGLGLSMVQGFIKQTGGHIKIYSEVGEGTTVRLFLPRAEGRVDAEEVAPDGLPHGHETVLLVEDDDMVREQVASMVGRLGYRLHVAANAADALEILASHDIKLLLTDVTLTGGLNGRQLSDKASVLYPQLRTVYMSGYTRNAIIHHGRLDKDTDLLEKPFRLNRLAQMLRKVLDR